MATRHTVPKVSDVIPGAHVSIVLKADQPTGREVQGTVRDVLTRGDHYRGIKVRLTDGRIGRVQRMMSGSTGPLIASPDASTTGSSESTPDGSTRSRAGPSGRHGQMPRYRDVRLDEPLDAPTEQIDLAAYIVPSKRKGKGKRGAKVGQPADATDGNDNPVGNDSGTVANATVSIATCPVCNEFEGDEAAVAHHVTSHFE